MGLWKELIANGAKIPKLFRGLFKGSSAAKGIESEAKAVISEEAKSTAEQAAKVAKDAKKAATTSSAASAAATATEETAAATAKIPWYRNPNNWKTAARYSYRGAKETANFTYKVGAGVAHNAKNIAVLGGTGWLGYHLYKGDGIIKPIYKSVGGTDAEQGGAVNLLEQVAVGDGASRLHDKLNGAVDEAGNMYYGLRDGTVAVAHEIGDAYQGGKSMLMNAYNGNGMVSNGYGGYYDPSNPYPQMDHFATQQQYDNGMVSGLMGGMNSALGSVTGGSISKMNLGALLLSAYMMFGRFGWLGKAASLLLGGMTLKNINNNQSMAMQPSMHQYQQQAAPQYTAAQSSSGVAEDEDNIVHMSRKL